MTYLSELSFINVLDLLNTFAFAISGIRLASVTKMDWFGAYVIGLVTAIGGGTTRDLLLDVKPVWMEDPNYIIVTLHCSKGIDSLHKNIITGWTRKHSILCPKI